MEPMTIIELASNPHCAKAGVLNVNSDYIEWVMLDEAEQRINPDAVNTAGRSNPGWPVLSEVKGDIENALGIE